MTVKDVFFSGAQHAQPRFVCQICCWSVDRWTFQFRFRMLSLNEHVCRPTRQDKTRQDKTKSYSRGCVRHIYCISATYYIQLLQNVLTKDRHCISSASTAAVLPKPLAALAASLPTSVTHSSRGRPRRRTNRSAVERKHFG